MEDMKTSWRTASYTGNGGGNCVEVGGTDRAIVVRDTKDRDGGLLAFSPQAWRALVAKIKNDA